MKNSGRVKCNNNWTTAFKNQCSEITKGNKHFFFALLLIILCFFNNVYAANYIWLAESGHCCRVLVTPPYPTSKAICEAGAVSFTYSYHTEQTPVVYVWTGLKFEYSRIYKKSNAAVYTCMYTPIGGAPHHIDQTMGIMRVGDSCPSGTTESEDGSLCIPEVPIVKNTGKSCKNDDIFKGNPINIAIGNKYQREVDYRSGGAFPLSISRSYNSETSGWRFFPEIIGASNDSTINAVRADGKGRPFRKEGSAWITDADIVGTLTAAEDDEDNITSWTYATRNDQIETYNAQGRILSITERNGLSHSYTYQTDSITVTHSSGDTLVYHLDSEGRVSGFTNPDNKTYQYSYDTEGRLVGITFPDATPVDTTDNPQRIYHYENSTFPHALTGITDENGNRYATWSYDSEGRAISSEHSGGVDKTTLTYNADGTTTVTNPLGKQTTYHFTTIHGVRKVTQVEGHPTASCEGANKAYSYDANGNVSSKTDWNSVTTTYVYDMDRNLELTRTEASGTPQARTITTEWHPQFRLPAKITEPGKITEYIYDAQGRKLSRSVQSVQQGNNNEIRIQLG